MSTAKDHQIHNWREFFFPPSTQVIDRGEETSVLQLVNQWRRRFLLFILTLLAIVILLFGLDNLLHLHRAFFGYLLVASSLCLSFATYKVYQSPTNILVFQLMASSIIIVVTTAGALANGILPMVLFAAVE